LILVKVDLNKKEVFHKLLVVKAGVNLAVTI